MSASGSKPTIAQFTDEKGIFDLKSFSKALVKSQYQMTDTEVKQVLDAYKKSYDTHLQEMVGKSAIDELIAFINALAETKLSYDWWNEILKWFLQAPTSKPKPVRSAL
jgi:hypothetical protein